MGAITKSITATSRASVSINKNYFTVEYSEERIIPDTEDIDIEEERKKLWYDVNREVDDQIQDIYDNFEKN